MDSDVESDEEMEEEEQSSPLMLVFKFPRSDIDIQAILLGWKRAERMR